MVSKNELKKCIQKRTKKVATAVSCNSTLTTAGYRQPEARGWPASPSRSRSQSSYVVFQPKEKLPHANLQGLVKTIAKQEKICGASHPC